jgi:hypothetical protein
MAVQGGSPGLIAKQRTHTIVDMIGNDAAALPPAAPVLSRVTLRLSSSSKRRKTSNHSIARTSCRMFDERERPPLGRFLVNSRAKRPFRLEPIDFGLNMA